VPDLHDELARAGLYSPDFIDQDMLQNLGYPDPDHQDWHTLGEE
jgi:hypothetical protein